MGVINPASKPKPVTNNCKHKYSSNDKVFVLYCQLCGNKINNSEIYINVIKEKGSTDNNTNTDIINEKTSEKTNETYSTNFSTEGNSNTSRSKNEYTIIKFPKSELKIINENYIQKVKSDTYDDKQSKMGKVFSNNKSKSKSSKTIYEVFIPSYSDDDYLINIKTQAPFIDFKINTKASDSIFNIKAKIYNQLKIHPDKQRLTSTIDGRILKNNKTLSDYNIRKDDVIYLSSYGEEIEKSVEKQNKEENTNTNNTKELTKAITKTLFKIYVKVFNGNTYTINAKPTDSVSNIKYKVQLASKISTDSQRLIFGGKQLENYRTVSDYGVNPEDTLHLILKIK